MSDKYTHAVKINDDYDIKRDKFQWILTHWTDGVGKAGDNKGKPIRVKRESFHASVTQICREILDRELGNCETVADMRNLLENAVSELTGYVEGKL